MIKIRRASREDIPWILVQLVDFSKFFGTKKKLFGSANYCAEYVQNVVDTQFMLVSENKEERTGFIAGLILNHPFNPDIKVLQELWWWVPEVHRGGRSGLMLFKQFEEYGNRHCDWTLFTLEHESPVSDRVLIKNGFKQKEITYMKESSWQQ